MAAKIQYFNHRETFFHVEHDGIDTEKFWPLNLRSRSSPAKWRREETSLSPLSNRRNNAFWSAGRGGRNIGKLTDITNDEKKKRGLLVPFYWVGKKTACPISPLWSE